MLKNLSVVHDSYLCQEYPSLHWRPFPTQRPDGEYNFVGAAGRVELRMMCPEECRPPDHLDWQFC